MQKLKVRKLARKSSALDKNARMHELKTKLQHILVGQFVDMLYSLYKSPINGEYAKIKPLARAIEIRKKNESYRYHNE